MVVLYIYRDVRDGGGRHCRGDVPSIGLLLTDVDRGDLFDTDLTD